MRKTAYEIVSSAFEELEKLNPTPEENEDYANLNQDVYYGLVTYSKSKGGSHYFLRLHDTWRKNWWKSPYRHWVR